MARVYDDKGNYKDYDDKGNITGGGLAGTEGLTVPTGSSGGGGRSGLRGAEELSKLYGGITYDEGAIRRKFDAATKAEYNMLRREYDATANQFYGQMYGAQNTALDTIRRANAEAVATGASRGIQAANELSAILGLEQETSASATQLAQDRNLLMDKEAAAYTQNAVNALTTSNQVKQALGTLGANIYASDTQFDVGQLNYYAMLNQAAQALEGAKFTANSNLEGTKYASDKNLEGNKYNADSNVKAAGISASATVEAARIANAAQTEYYKNLATQSTGNMATDFEKSMKFLQDQYNTFLRRGDYDSAAMWWAQLTKMDYKDALKNIKDRNKVETSFKDISISNVSKYTPSLFNIPSSYPRVP